MNPVRWLALAVLTALVALSTGKTFADPAPVSTPGARDLFLEARSRERGGEDSAALALYLQAQAKDPRNRELCFMVLERLRYAVSVDSAFSFARRCAALPGKPRLSELKTAGELALRAEDDSAALSFYRAALEIDGDDGDVLYVLAGLYEEARDWKRYAAVTGVLAPKLGYPAPLVERLLRAQTLLDRPDSALALLKAAWLATGRVPYGEALARYYDGRGLSMSLLEVARALARQEPGPEHEALLARAYAAADRPDSALIVSARVLKSLDDSDDALESLRYFHASLLFEQGRYAEAWAEASALAKARPEAPSLLFLQGSSALELRKREAIPLLTKALSFVPLSPDYRARLAYAGYVQRSPKILNASSIAAPSLAYAVNDSLNPEQALMLEGFAQGQLARMLDPREPWERRAVLTDSSLARRHRLLAADRFSQVLGGLRGGDSQVDSVAQDSPGTRAASFELATHLERLGEHARAKTLLRRLIARDSSNPMALNYLGYMLVENAPVDSIELVEAGTLLARAVAMEPENGAYLDSRGWWFYRTGNLDSARVLLEAAARSIPSDPSILMHQVEVLDALGRSAEACALWPEITRRDPRRKPPQGCAR